MIATGTAPRAEQDLARLRADLLGGRGPGASADEVASHTRQRPTLGAVPPAVERAIAAGQTRRARAGSPVPTGAACTSREHLRIGLAGAAGGLVLRSVMAHLLGPRRRPDAH